MSPPGPDHRITRDEIEAKFRELTGEIGEEAESARQSALVIGLAVGASLLVLVFLLGRRAGRRRSTVVEVRRL